MPPEPSDAAAAETREEFALVRGLRDTRGALEHWIANPGPVLSSWFGGALAVAFGLLGAVWAVSLVSAPDLTPYRIPGATDPAGFGDYATILGRNGLVLALHATACVAGFIAGSSLQRVAATKAGFSRFVHDRAGPIAIGWVILVTAFSLTTQAVSLGFNGATIADQLGISPGVLILTVLPHALIELTAIFLPLAAWLIASRRNQWHDLLAATFVTVAFAIPMLLIAAAIEVFVWPELLTLASPRLL